MKITGKIVNVVGEIVETRNFGHMTDDEIERVLDVFQAENPDTVIRPVRLTGKKNGLNQSKSTRLGLTLFSYGSPRPWLLVRLEKYTELILSENRNSIKVIIEKKHLCEYLKAFILATQAWIWY